MKLAHIRSRLKPFRRFGHKFDGGGVLVAITDDVDGDADEMRKHAVALVLSEKQYDRLLKESEHEHYPLAITSPDDVMVKVAQKSALLDDMAKHESDMRAEMDAKQAKLEAMASEMAIREAKLKEMEERLAAAEKQASLNLATATPKPKRSRKKVAAKGERG